ncbi:MAG TPA: sigma-70 family RNA polymerase sigma factor [Terriglobales bacterium]|nr:sigma-70 family RNA polymerase sigma factor [Terriglobales bacterium]
MWRQNNLNHQATATTTERSTEAEAIERAKAGSADAFEFLYHLHKRRVYSLCLRMTGNTAEAEDLAQEAFLQLFRKIGTFRGESAFSTWLHRLSVNVVLMHLRRKSLPETPLEDYTEPAQEDGPRREIGARDQTLAGSIDRVNLERAIERLPPGYRTIFVLHDMEGYEHNEIAGMMGCSIGNSKSQLHKARMKLRDILQTPRLEVRVEARGDALAASAPGGAPQPRAAENPETNESLNEALKENSI